MANLALLVMAAGSGTRYGGLKQVDPIGPSGEALVEYSIFDAARTGFSKVVFVIRRDIEDVFRSAVGDRVAGHLPVEYVFQDEMTPAECEVIERKKPWGTAHAILAASPAIDQPFAVVNADDYYGHESFQVLSNHLQSADLDTAMVGFELRKTLSEFGPVRRGLCAISNGELQTVRELHQIAAEGDHVQYLASDGSYQELTGDEIVSMNMWGYAPAIFDYLHAKWREFISASGASEDAEYFIPDVMTKLIAEGKGRCRVLNTRSSWFGVTYREDYEAAKERIRTLIESGSYPEKLWQ